MPIDKVEKIRPTDTDPSSIRLDVNFNRIIGCYKCGESKFTLERVRDNNGNKIRPAKYICSECKKNENIRKMRKV